MGAFAPDGRTYYLTQNFRGVGGHLYIVDLSNPSHPRMLPAGRTRATAGPTG